MKIGIVIYSNDPETAWNAVRLGNFSLKQGESVRILLLARGGCAEGITEPPSAGLSIWRSETP